MAAKRELGGLATAGTQGAATLRVWWTGLAARERALLLAMAVSISGATLYVAWLEPVLQQRAQWRERVPLLRAQAQALAPLLEARRRQLQRPVVDSALLRATLAEARLGGPVVLNEHADTWELQVQGAPADALWTWLLPVLADPAVTLQELQLERTGDVDMPAAKVSGRIVMGHSGSGNVP